ncbi:MAG: hypothetical protein WBO55_10325 [Rhizobiaceae bacterium]
MSVRKQPSIALEDMPPLPKFKETKVARYPAKLAKEFALVKTADRPDHIAYKPLDKEYQLPDTYYVVERATRLPVAYVTQMPDGLIVAWSGCRQCHRNNRRCICKGISVCRSVEYIYDKTAAAVAGEEWNFLHPNYNGSITGKAAAKRQAAWDSRARDVRPLTARKPSTAATGAGKRLRKAVNDAPDKKVLRKSSTAAPVVDDTQHIVSGGKVSHKELDKAAVSSAADIERQLLRRAAATPHKTLRKVKK